MPVTETHKWSIREIQAELQAGRITAEELTDSHIRRLEETEPRLNAIAVPLYEQAMAAAKTADHQTTMGEPFRKLRGVPVTVKECFDMEGVPGTAGVSALSGRRADRDSAIVSALRRAGAIIIGKSNLAQLAWFNEADNPMFGRTNNPWDRARATGGSSGGEGAVVAAAGSVAGVGTDSGGSVRLPAHFCGIHAFKPTSGRLSTRGTVDDFLLAGQEGVINQAGPLARCVEDLEAVMEALVADNTSHDSSVAPAAWRSFRDVTVSDLRIGFYADLAGLQTSASIERLTMSAVAALEERGAKLSRFQPPDTTEASGIYARLFTADGGRALRSALADSKRDWRIERLLRGMDECGEATLEEYFALIERRTSYRKLFVEALNKDCLDAVVSPPFPYPAFNHGRSPEFEDAEIFTAIYNLVGLPAGVVAASRVFSEEDPSDKGGISANVAAADRGLPVGVQVAARHWREDVALSIMAALEEHFRGGPLYPHLPPV